jgi:hypothetical protein
MQSPSNGRFATQDHNHVLQATWTGIHRCIRMHTWSALAAASLQEVLRSSLSARSCKNRALNATPRLPSHAQPTTQLVHRAYLRRVLGVTIHFVASRHVSNRQGSRASMLGLFSRKRLLTLFHFTFLITRDNDVIQWLNKVAHMVEFAQIHAFLVRCSLLLQDPRILPLHGLFENGSISHAYATRACAGGQRRRMERRACDGHLQVLPLCGLSARASVRGAQRRPFAHRPDVRGPARRGCSGARRVARDRDVDHDCGHVTERARRRRFWVAAAFIAVTSGVCALGLFQVSGAVVPARCGGAAGARRRPRSAACLTVARARAPRCTNQPADACGSFARCGSSSGDVDDAAPAPAR